MVRLQSVVICRSHGAADGIVWPATGYGTGKAKEALMKNGDKIVSLIPAAGYYAEYKDGDESTFNPVAAWVVIEDRQGRQRVDGVDPSGDGWDGSPCGYRDAFVGFVYREERERRR